MNLNFLVSLLRAARALHKYFGVGIAMFFMVIAVTGIALGWKKNISTLQPVTQRGSSVEMRHWKSLEEIAQAAIQALDSLGVDGTEIDRMDTRPDRGIIKVQFREGYWEAQVDAATGQVLSVARRHADWIERIHDGSIITDLFKIGYTNIAGTGLLMLSLSGIWLWVGPKIFRRWKSLHK